MSSNNKVLTFPIILSIIGVILWVTASFMGFVYTAKQLFVAALFALAVLIFLGLGIYLLVWTSLTQSINQGPKRTIRIISWVLYISGSLVSLYFLNHYLRVSLEYKDDIQTEVSKKLDELETVYSDDTNLENSFAHYLDQQLSIYVISQVEGLGKDRGTMNIEAKDIRGKVYGTAVDLDNPETSTYSDVKRQIKASGYRAALVDNWNLFNANKELQQFKKDCARWETYAGEFSNLWEVAKKEPYSFEFTPTSNKLDSLSTTDYRFIWQSIVVAIILQIMMLLPVFMTIDWSTGVRKANVTTI